MRLLSLFSRTERAYDKAILAVDHAIKSEADFSLDANIIIEIASHHDSQTLDKITTNWHFHIFRITYSEISGLYKAKCKLSGEWDPATCSLIESFLKKVQNKVRNETSSKEEVNLSQLIVLLPRKIVHDAIFNESDSLINSMIEKFNELLFKLRNTFSDKEIKQIVIEATKFRKGITEDYIWENFVVQLYLTRAGKLNIDESKLDERAYEKECRKHINIAKNEIETELKRALGSSVEEILNSTVQKLRNIASKTHSADVRFVKASVESAITGYSLDSDVIWLYELHTVTQRAIS